MAHSEERQKAETLSQQLRSQAAATMSSHTELEARQSELQAQLRAAAQASASLRSQL
eukprot:COSAG01_NODE_4242_length_5211_cov_24.571401_3_plen_57_part_00